MPALDILVQDSLSDALLADERNSSIASFITHEACKQFYNTYKSKWIPTSFIEFYFEEYKRYDFMSKNYLTPFFKKYSADDIPAIVENYYNEFYSVIKRKSNKKDQLCYYIVNNYYLQANLHDPDLLGEYDPDLYKNLGQIAKHMENHDELVTIQETYEYFMLKKIVLSHDFKKSMAKRINTESQSKVEPAISNPTLVGEQSDMPKQKGKVVKLYFPRLSLPSPYPILNEKSRINSEHRVKKFMSNDIQIKFINKYRFNGVKYKMGFIEKRKAAQKRPRRKFDFDF